MASFYLRAACMNRNIWGAEGFQEISIRHSKFAARRFVHEAAPALERFANASTTPFTNGSRLSEFGSLRCRCHLERLLGRRHGSHAFGGRQCQHNIGVRFQVL